MLRRELKSWQPRIDAIIRIFRSTPRNKRFMVFSAPYLKAKNIHVEMQKSKKKNCMHTYCAIHSWNHNRHNFVWDWKGSPEKNPSQQCHQLWKPSAAKDTAKLRFLWGRFAICLLTCFLFIYTHLSGSSNNILSWGPNPSDKLAIVHTYFLGSTSTYFISPHLHFILLLQH